VDIAEIRKKIGEANLAISSIMQKLADDTGISPTSIDIEVWELRKGLEPDVHQRLINVSIKMVVS